MTEPNIHIPNISPRRLVAPDGNVLEYFVGSMSSDLAKALTFVPVISESKKTYLNEEIATGYQRPGSAARMRAFGEFLRQNPLSVVPPVILSGRGKWKPSRSGIDVYGRAAVIDGQHRLGGYVWLYETHQIATQVDFIILPALTLEQETSEFLTINNHALGVPKAIDVMLSNDDDSIVAVQLATDSSSPFYQRIKMERPLKGALFSLPAVKRNVIRSFNHGAFAGIDADGKLEILIEYWNIIQDTFPEQWEDINRSDPEYKLLETTGLIACSFAAEDIIGPSYDPGTRTMNWDAVRTKWLKIEERGLDWEKEGKFRGLTGELGGKAIHKEIQALLSSGDYEIQE